MRVAVFGANGLVGRNLVERLNSHPAIKIIKVFTRSDINFHSPKIKLYIADYESFNKIEEELSVEAVFCCIGTTKAKTPDRELYYEIEHDYPLKIAKLALAQGATSFHYISSMGANQNSRIFYLRVKGETERDLRLLDYPRMHLYRPSLLLGARQERRWAERSGAALLKVLRPVLFGKLKKYRGTPARSLAEYMVAKEMESKKGSFVYEAEKLN